MDPLIFPEITSYLAVFLTVLLAVLTARVSVRRQSTATPFGEGDTSMTRHVRMQANLTETAAIVLVTLGFAEAAGASAMGVSGVAILYAVARIAHVIGLGTGDGTGPFRAIGGGGTLVSLIASAVLLGFEVFA